MTTDHQAALAAAVKRSEAVKAAQKAEAERLAQERAAQAEQKP